MYFSTNWTSGPKADATSSGNSLSRNTCTENKQTYEFTEKLQQMYEDEVEC